MAGTVASSIVPTMEGLTMSDQQQQHEQYRHHRHPPQGRHREDRMVEPLNLCLVDRRLQEEQEETHSLVGTPPRTPNTPSATSYKKHILKRYSKWIVVVKRFYCSFLFFIYIFNY